MADNGSAPSTGQAVETRVSALELDTKVMTAEVGSLRASRHTHGQWLNRHNLEIQELKLTQNEFQKTRFEQIESTIEQLVTKQDSVQNMVLQLAGDIRLNSWKVGLIIAALVFVLNLVANRWKL